MPHEGGESERLRKQKCKNHRKNPCKVTHTPFNYLIGSTHSRHSPRNVRFLIVITNDYRSRGYSLAPKISPILGGRRYGLWLGILAALSLPYTSVRPGVWKRSIGLSGKDKEQGRAR